MKNLGFTLVELSIVLVIIGLLVGGILAAQSMISTSKIQAEVKQIQQFDAAINNFKTKYNQLPGDSTLFGHVGDNNGKIWSGVPSNYSAPYFTNEVKYVWLELQQGVSLLTEYTFDTSDSCIPTVCKFSPPSLHMPASALKDGTGVMVGYDQDYSIVNKMFMPFQNLA